MYEIFVFDQKLPFYTKNCLARNAEMHSLAYKYNLDSSLDLVQVLQDIQVFVDVNFLMAHQWTVDWY